MSHVGTSPPLERVLMIVDTLPKGYEDKYPFKAGDTVLVLGEIKNMKGHYIIALKDGRVLYGYHDDFFREPTEEEL